MSFGWGVGDLIAGANLTYTLIKNLSDTQGACIEYQEAIHELGSLQHAFMRIEYLRLSGQVDAAAINGASYLVTSAIGLIEQFLEKTKKYRQRMGAGSPGSMVSSSWLKIGWTLFRKEELVALKVALNTKLMSLTLLLTTANVYDSSPKNSSIHKYQVDSFNVQNDSNDPHSLGNSSLTPQSSQASISNDPLIGMNLQRSREYATDTHTPSYSPLQNPQPSERGASLGSSSNTQDSTRTGQTEDKDSEVVTASLDFIPQQSLDRLEDFILQATDNRANEPKPVFENSLDRLEDLILRATGNQVREHNSEPKKEPIKFKDAVGRKFSFPFHLCATWAGMEELIKQAFLSVEVIGPHVAEGHYDLIGPNGEIILPPVWECFIEPGLNITMHLWPIPDPPAPKRKLKSYIDVSLWRRKMERKKKNLLFGQSQRIPGRCRSLLQSG